MEPPEPSPRFPQIPQATETTAAEIVDAAIRVHIELGPGLLERLYRQALAYELGIRGLEVRTEVPVPSRYRDIALDGFFRLDLQVEEDVVVEVKAVETLLPVHEAQLLTYLRLTDQRLGFLLNFHVDRMKDGIRRFVL